MAILALLVVACSGCSDRDDPASEYLARSVDVGGKSYQYRVYVPKRRDPNVKFPVMLFLHGSGFRGSDNIAQVDSFRWSIDPFKEKFDVIAVLPQCPGDTFWASAEVAKYSLAALDATVAEFNGDPNRIYLAGFSMGGYGTWHIAAANPGKFAALVPIAGGVVGERPVEPRERAVVIPEIGKMLDSPDPYRACAMAIGKTPAWVFHGDADEAVSVDYSRKIVQALKEAGNDRVKYTEYAGDGHMIIGKAFSEPGFLEWLTKQRLSEGK